MAKKWKWIFLTLVLTAICPFQEGRGAEEGTKESERAVEENAEAARTAEETMEADRTYQTEYFSLTVSPELQKIGDITVSERGISFFEKISREGFGGFVGTIGAFERVADYSCYPSFQKRGEIVLADGKVLNIVLTLPSDVQYDYEDTESRDHYRAIYEEMVALTDTLVPPAGGKLITTDETDHTGIYRETLDTLIRDLKEEKNAEELLADGFSSVYAKAYGTGDPLEAVGYAFVDMEYTGYPELAILDVNRRTIVDLFAQVDGEVIHPICAAEDMTYGYAGQEGYPPYEMWIKEMLGKKDYRISFYIFNPGTKELYHQVSFFYLPSEYPEGPCFYGYGLTGEEGKDLSAIQEEDWQERLDGFPMDYLPEDLAVLSTWK